MRVKRPGRKADHSPPYCVEVKEWVGLCLHSANTTSWRSARLKKSVSYYFPSSLNSKWKGCVTPNN